MVEDEIFADGNLGIVEGAASLIVHWTQFYSEWRKNLFTPAEGVLDVIRYGNGATIVHWVHISIHS